jgi:glycosyltransferase involved in cell wall biosynthesis
MLARNQIGGMERQALLLAGGLRDRNIEVIFLFCGIPNMRPGKPRLDFSGLRTVQLWDSRYTRRISTRFLSSLIRKFGIEHLLAYQYHSILLAKLAYMLDSRFSYYPNVRGIGFASDEVVRRQYQDACTDGKKVVCNCENTKSLLVEKGISEEERTIVIENGVPLPKERDASRPRRLNVLFAGSLKDVKDPMCFAEAACLCAERNPAMTFTIAGDGPLKGRMNEYFKERGVLERVTFLGNVLPEDIPYRDAGLVVSSSIREGSSNSILEALSYGVPAVATAVGGTPDILENQPFGILVPPQSPQRICEGILELSGKSLDELQSMSRKARQYIKERFDPDRMVDRYVNLFSGVS